MQWPARHLVCVAALTLPVSATTYFVDDDGGPGVDFTDIPAAVAVAVAGDVVLVAPGTYSAFTLDAGVAILGAGAGETLVSSGTVTVRDVPAGELAVLSGLASGLPCCTPFHLIVFQNAGTVVLEDLVLETDVEVAPGIAVVSVLQNADVRIHRCTFVGSGLGNGEGESGLTALLVSNSRVEVVQSSVFGGFGDFGCCSGSGGTGAPGILALGASRVHLARSSVRGGRGGGISTPPGQGGDGAPAIRILAPAEVIVAGVLADTIRGGDAGFDTTFPFDDGEPGPGVLVEGGRLRHSGATLAGGAGSPGAPSVDSDARPTSTRRPTSCSSSCWSAAAASASARSTRQARPHAPTP